MAIRLTKIELYRAVTQIEGLDLQQRGMPQPRDGVQRYYFRAEGFNRTCLGLSEAAEYVTGVQDGLQLAREARNAEMDDATEDAILEAGFRDGHGEDWDKADDRHGEDPAVLADAECEDDRFESLETRIQAEMREDPEPDSGPTLGLEPRGVSS